jgi:hypothetical protein
MCSEVSYNLVDGNRGHVTAVIVPSARNASRYKPELQFIRTGAPGEARTPDLLIRSQSLYPTELRARCINCFIIRVRKFE